MRQYNKNPSLKAVIEKAQPKPMIELTEDDIEKLKSYAEVLLAVLKTTTLLSMIVLAPNAIQALAIFERKRTGKRLSHKQKVRLTAQVFNYCKRRNYIKMERLGEDNIKVIIKDKGKKQMRLLDRKLLKIPRSRWDGKFWLIALDIPLKKKSQADMFRRQAKRLGLFFLQKTMWFYPYDPRAEIEFLARDSEVAQYVTIMKIEEMDPEDNKTLKSYFKEQAII